MALLLKKNMAIISSQSLFDWSQIEESGDLERFRLILRTIPDEPLMELLETKRGYGVDKYPIRAVWNSLLALVVFQHLTIESLRRELTRNPSLAKICGFNIFHGEAAIPTSGCYSRFISKLMEHQDEMRKIFEVLLDLCYENLEGFGENLAIDGKALDSYAAKTGCEGKDRRGDTDAKWGKHVIRCEGSDGKVHEKVKSWFGYTLHLIADTRYELPVAFSVLPANSAEAPIAHKFIDAMNERTPQRLEKCNYFSADRGYDDTKLHKKLWDEHQIKPIIDIRRSWQDGEETRMFGDDGVVYDNYGTVSCISPHFGDQKTMPYRGFEQDRGALKYACPSVHYGIECRDKNRCRIGNQIRVPISVDRRIFSPVARSSYKWKKLYNNRSAIERVNSRIDRMFGFENHTIRGLKKMGFRITLSFILMLSFAVGKALENKPDDVRCFLSA